jgi:hypothetical protein
MGFLEFAAWFTAPPLNPTCSLLTVAARAFECHLPRHLMAVAILLGKVSGPLNSRLKLVKGGVAALYCGLVTQCRHSLAAICCVMTSAATAGKD